MSVLAIIPAAGWGVRMGGATPKQFLSLEGVPIFVHTLRKFAACGAVDAIYLGLRAEDTERAQREIERAALARPVLLVEGGPSRQETVARCLEQAPPDTEVVLVHDAVRPFVDMEIIPRLIAAARQEGAVILGIPSVDTVKQVDRHIILGSIPRERIVLAQTPQAFRYEMIHEAYARAGTDGFRGTDDSSLVERLGHSVQVMMGSDRNIKITKPSDLPLARLFIALEREPQEAAKR
jgi:2-C-methyl-D-erythritol 4-phosphate cytidylyltransferase